MTALYFLLRGGKMNLIIKGIDQINRVVTWIAVAMLVVMSSVIFTQVVFRYALAAPLPWSEELARYLMMWLTFLGAGLAVRKKALLGMEVLVRALPKVLNRIAVGLVFLIQSVFLIVVLIYGVKMTIITSRQLSPAMLIQMSWPYLSIPVGAALMLINTIAVALESKWGGVN